MKPYLLVFIAVCACMLSCKKQDKTKHFTIVASKPDSISAVLTIDNKTYAFTDAELQKDIVVEEYGVSDVELTCNSNMAVLELREGNNSLGIVAGTAPLYMIIENSGVYYSSASAGGSTTTGGGCATVQCSATTQSGSRCKRTTTNCNGRCWQHQ